jgi:hypothetical protein
MNSISWTDLTPAEQRAIAVLAAGISIELCDTAALITMRRAGLVSFNTKSRKIAEIRRAASAGSLNDRCPVRVIRVISTADPSLPVFAGKPRCQAPLSRQH